MFKAITRQREFGIAAVIVVLSVIMSFVSPVFTSEGNIKSIFMALSIETVIAIAMTNLMVSGGFDMSVGSVLGFTGVICGMLIKAGAPIVFAIFAALVAGALIGLINGLIISKVGINAFITTLAGLSMYRGLTFVLTQGVHQSGLGAAFNFIGQATFFGIQFPIFYALILVIVGDIILRRSRFFRRNYYIGGNEYAARLSGINVDKTKIINYMITGIFAALAGIIMAARMGSASVVAGQGMELRVITAVIIGGASLNGGEGTVLGSFFGSLLMVLIMDILTLLSIDINWQQFVVGATLLLAVMMDTLNNKRALKKQKARRNRLMDNKTQAA